MKAILIDAVERTVSEVDYDGSLDEAYRLVRCDVIDVVRCGGGNVLIIDDEGLLNAESEDSPFIIVDGAVLAGSALVVGEADENGDTTPTSLSAEFVASRTSFTAKGALAAAGCEPEPRWEFRVIPPETGGSGSSPETP